MTEVHLFDMVLVTVAIFAAVAVFAWNFIPSVRERMRGWTTWAEAGLGSALVFTDYLAATLRDEVTVWSTVISDDLWPAVTLGVMLWFGVFKRWITTTAIGMR